MNYVLGFALSLFTGVAVAQPADDMESSKPTSVNQDFSQWCQVGGHRFTLEKATLASVIHTFGSGSIERDGDAGAATFQYFIRYRCENKIITFESNNDMGGPTHDLEEVDVRDASGSPDELKLPLITGPTRFPFGEPGMSFDLLQSRLGKTTLVNGHAEYEYPGKRFGKDFNGKPIEYDVSGWMRVKVKGGKIAELELSRITTE